MDSRLELLRSIGKARLRSEKRRTQFVDLISRLKQANNARNTVVHGKWQTNGVGVMRVLMDGPEKHPPAIVKKRRLNSDPLTASANDIEKVALELANLTWELTRFSKFLLRPSSLGKALKAAASH